MRSRTEAVKQFFDIPQVYLQKNVTIAVRSLIVRELVGSLDSARILDIGCGDGSISLPYASATNTLVLVDLSDAMLAHARQNTPPAFQSSVRYINADIHICRDLGQFDLILCLGVLAHVASVEQMVARVAALLKPGGLCIFQITDADSFGGRLFNALNKTRGAIKRTHGYALNSTRWKQLRWLAHRNDLTLVDTRQYMALFPGMGKLPNRWLYAYQIYTLRHTPIARFGSEIVGLFRRGNEQDLVAATHDQQDIGLRQSRLR